MATCVGLAMVTFLSWMANAKTTSCIVRILVGNRNGSILRSVGSNSMPLLVLYLRQGCHVVCQHVHKVVLFLLWRTFVLGLEFFGLFGVFLASCAYGEFWLCLAPCCVHCWTRPLGGGRWGHYLCNLWEEYLSFHKTAYTYLGIYGYFLIWEPYMRPLARQPSLHGNDACMVYWTQGALRRNRRQRYGKTSFSPSRVFCLVVIPGYCFWV